MWSRWLSVIQGEVKGELLVQAWGTGRRFPSTEDLRRQGGAGPSWVGNQI